MANPYIGEVRMVGFNFPPPGWEPCDGRLLPISEHEALFTLIGTTYGGDGQSTFALPDLRGRIPVHMGAGRVLAESGGTETETLTLSQMPAHTHPVLGSANRGTTAAPAGSVPAVSVRRLYAPPLSGSLAPVPMRAGTAAPAGGGQPHDNVHPFQCVSFIIAVEGIFPSRP
jgi:microcystin-dependent protein